MKSFALKILAVPVAFCPFALHAAAMINTNEIPQLRPLHAELPPTFWEQHGSVVIMAALAAIILIALVILVLTRPQPPVIIPPAEQARTALTALPANASDGIVLSRISQILRHYVRRAFELPPGELTTTEFCRQLSSDQKIGLALALALSEFLRENDRQKFSPVTLSQPAVSPVTQALALIEKCEARLATLNSGQPSPSPAADKPA